VAASGPGRRALSGRSVALDEAAPRPDVARGLAGVAAAAGPAARVAALEAFLLGLRAGRAHAPDPVAAAAADAIRRAHGLVRVADLARAAGLGRGRLEERFRRAVGAPPKRIAALVRLRRALALHRAGATLTRAAAAAGYADQSHLVRAFRACAGEPPRRFLRTAEHCRAPRRRRPRRPAVAPELRDGAPTLPRSGGCRASARRCWRASCTTRTTPSSSPCAGAPATCART
jgi:AraC-like DNA-binding protein